MKNGVSPYPMPFLKWGVSLYPNMLWSWDKGGVSHYPVSHFTLVSPTILDLDEYRCACRHLYSYYLYFTDLLCCYIYYCLTASWLTSRTAVISNNLPNRLVWLSGLMLRSHLQMKTHYAAKLLKYLKLCCIPSVLVHITGYQYQLWLHFPTAIRRQQHILDIFTLANITVSDSESSCVWYIHTYPQLGTSSSCWSLT